MASVVVPVVGLPGSIGFRVVERYCTNLHVITQNYINGQITLKRAVEQIREHLSLHIVLSTGKLISDVATVGSVAYWIYQLGNIIGSNLANITVSSGLQEFCDRLIQLRAVILGHFAGMEAIGVHSLFAPGEVISKGNVRICPGLIHTGIGLLTILGWVVHQVIQTGSFFWTELLKYFLVAWAAFYAAAERWDMVTNRVRNYFHRFEPNFSPEVSADLRRRMNINLRMSIDDYSEIPFEDNSIPSNGEIKDLRNELDDVKNKLETEQNRNVMLVHRIQNVEAQINEIRMPDFINVPLTLEQVNSGFSVEIRGRQVHIPPGSLASKQIEVFAEENNQYHLMHLPSFVVRVQELPHQWFQRENQNLIYEAAVDLSFIYPRPGRTLTIPSITSATDHVIEIDGHTTIGLDTRLTVPSAGLPGPNNSAPRGNIIIKFQIRPPTPEELCALAAQLSNI